MRCAPIKEQFFIRNEIIGCHLQAIYYAPKLDAWDFDIKDESVIHIPMGILTFKLSNGNYYQLNTNYQEFNSGSFGILIDKIEEEAFLRNKFDLDIDYFNQLKVWDKFKKLSIESINWKWKAGKEYRSIKALVHQILSSCCYFCFLFPSTALKFLAVAMAMSKCRTIGLPNHRSAESFKFCFAEENNIQKNTDTNLELNALAFEEVTHDIIYDFVPESLVVNFENNESMCVLALEPDAEIPEKETYILMRGGEEFMIFLDETKLEKWVVLG